jgi:protein TonB
MKRFPALLCTFLTIAGTTAACAGGQTSSGPAASPAPASAAAGLSATIPVRVLSDADTPPVVKNASAVRMAERELYPSLLRDAGVEGSALVRMTVNADGSVDLASITVRDASHEAFGSAAPDVARRMRFTPAQRGGQAVPAIVEVPILFKLR